MNQFKIVLLISVGLIASCAINPLYDSTKAHHTQSGFKNIYYEDDKGFWAYMTWRWKKLFKHIPDVDDYDFQLADSRHAILKDNANNPSLTWIGHATFLIQFSGINILTDPQFSQRASPVTWAGPQRVIPPAYTIDALPEIDAVIISHDHYDSLDLASVVQLSKHNRQRPLTFLVPLAMKSWFDDLNLEAIEVVELDWAQSHIINGVRFTAEPSQHWSKRTLLDAYQRLWASWVIEGKGNRIFFAGDTGYAKHFKEIGNKYGHFDLALLPIGAYEPRWFMKPYHVNPEESVQIHKDIRSRYSVAMHWGTFILTDEPLDEPPGKLVEALKKYQIPKSEFEIYKHGETRLLGHIFKKNVKRAE
jgi:L-ascorbate metabolism protein UlaG (beta-lactamase superfamily)